RPSAPAGFTARLANTPVATIPIVPPTPCTPNTSSESSTLPRTTNSTTKKHPNPAQNPITNAAMGETKPEAGVIATSPDSAPAAAPSALGRSYRIQLAVSQVRAAIAAEVLVLTKAQTANEPEPIALPALNPNQPNQSSAAPSIVRVALCGSMG